MSDDVRDHLSFAKLLAYALPFVPIYIAAEPELAPFRLYLWPAAMYAIVLAVALWVVVTLIERWLERRVRRKG